MRGAKGKMRNGGEGGRKGGRVGVHTYLAAGEIDAPEAGEAAHDLTDELTRR
jgi:hypothetical protein